MIHVQDLHKSYGRAIALQGISFDVAQGEVVGFLGPNGAGKSTTMKILTGFLLPSGGVASVDGLDVVHQSLEVRRRIGYLPESTPLYTEMRVNDYLRFAAQIRGVSRSKSAVAVGRVVELCGLERVIGKNVLELSKGYRQRVGLAQAMVHEPDLLILDEPTSGLDPNQIIEVRSLIKRLGEQHTVILSTHYLQEVEAACSRVVIVNLGRIVADASKRELIAGQSTGRMRARVRGPVGSIRSQLHELLPDAAIEVQALDGAAGECELTVVPGTTGADVDSAVAHLIVNNGWGLLEFGRDKPSLEDVFRSLTMATPEPPAVEAARA